MKLQYRCEKCDRLVTDTAKKQYGSMRIIVLSCGHTHIEKCLSKTEDDQFDELISKNGCKLFPFQRRAVQFIEQADGRAILNLEMGLGKTICALAFLHFHKKEALPALIVTKSKIRMQWMSECFSWIGELAQVFQKTSEQPYPEIFPVGIVSIDSLDKMYDRLKGVYRTIVIDECQGMKNPSAKRTQAVQALCADAKFVIPMSGTPVKNNAAEYFVACNAVRPALFPSYAGFVRTWVNVERMPSAFGGYADKMTGIIPWMKDRWDDLTQQFILRMTRDEVMPELPTKFRRNFMVNLGDEVGERYLAELASMSERYKQIQENGEQFTAYAEVLGMLAKLRRITGTAKVEAVIDFIMDHLEETDRPIVAFYHHQDVRDIIYTALKAKGVDVTLISPDAPNLDKIQISCAENHWVSPHPDKQRVALVSTLGGGEGLNLQRACDAILIEPQWNPANEQQAEDRLVRIGSTVQQVNITKIVALETIDEALVKIVEAKRQAIGSIHNGESTPWNETEIVAELAKAVFEGKSKGFTGKIERKKRS